MPGKSGHEAVRVDRRIRSLIEEHAVRLLAEAYRDEIERAIDNAKRTDWDKRFRQGWYRAEAIRKALALAGKDDIVLIAGKGHETFQELENTVVPFDDREVVRDMMKNRGCQLSRHRTWSRGAEENGSMVNPSRSTASVPTAGRSSPATCFSRCMDPVLMDTNS